LPLVTRQANQGNLYNQETEPIGWEDGDLWSQPSTDSLFLNVGGTATAIGGEVVSDQVIMPYSTTIGDYTAPTAAVTSSDGGWLISDDFTSYANDAAAALVYPTNDAALIHVDAATNDLEFDWTNSGASKILYRDLGDGVVSDTKWILRAKFNFSNVGENTINTYPIGMQSQTGDSAATGDYIQTFYSNVIQQLYGDGVSMLGGSAGSGVPTPPTISTDQYWELARLTATSSAFKVFSDEFVTQQGDTNTGTPAAGITNLRYIKCFNRKDTGGGQITGVIEWIKFYNNLDFVPDASQLIADDTSQYWQSEEGIGESCYVDCGGSSINIGAVAVYIDKTILTETQIKIRGSTDTTFTDAENLRTCEVTELATGWNYLRFNIKNFRYLQIIGSSGSNLVLQANEIKYETYTDSEIIEQHGHIEIDGDTTGLANNGT